MVDFHGLVFPSSKSINCANLKTQTGTHWGRESQKAEVPVVLIPQASPQGTHTQSSISPFARVLSQGTEYPRESGCLKGTDQVLPLLRPLKVPPHSHSQTLSPQGTPSYSRPLASDPDWGGGSHHLPRSSGAGPEGPRTKLRPSPSRSFPALPDPT